MLARRLSLVVLDLLVFHSLSSLTKPVNITIDDTDGDPRTGVAVTYIPSDRWNVGQDCTGCLATVDRTRAHAGTWHDTSWVPPNDTLIQAQTPFHGTAVYVYGILELDQSAADILGTNDIYFFIDDNPVGHFSQVYDGHSTGTQYDVLMYSKDFLTLADHLLTIQVGPSNGVRSLFLLDYIVYTFDQNDPAPSPSPTTTSQSTSVTTSAVSSTESSSTTSTSESSSTTGSTSTAQNSTISSPTSSLSSSSTIGETSSVAGSTISSIPIPIPPYTSTGSPDPSPSTTIVTLSSSNSSHIALIAGIVAAVVGTIVILVLLIFLCRRKKHPSTNPTTEPEKPPLSANSTRSRLTRPAGRILSLPHEYTIVPFELDSPPSTANAPPSRKKFPGSGGGQHSRDDSSASSAHLLQLSSGSSTPISPVPPHLNVDIPSGKRSRKLPTTPIISRPSTGDSNTTNPDREMALTLAAENARLRELLREPPPPPYLVPVHEE